MMKKTGYKLILIIVLLGIILGIGSFLFERIKENKLVKHEYEQYNFEISYSNLYKDEKESGDSEKNILSNLTVTESGEQISDYMKNLKFVEVLEELKNDKKQIRLIIEAINKEKTQLTMEEICKRYVVMFKIYNDEAKIVSTEKEVVQINGEQIGKVTIEVEGKKENSILIAYLISLPDKEITVTFITPKKFFENNEKEINRIIKSIKF